MRILSCSLLAFVCVALACDSENKPSRGAEAEKTVASGAKEAEGVERRRQERAAKAVAETQAEEDKKKQIDALCTVPADARPPKTLGDACEAVVAAEASFIERAYAAEPEKLAKLEENSATQTQMTTRMCMGAGSMEVAMCQINALDTAPIELKKDVNEFMRICIDTYGAAESEGVGAGVPPESK